MTCIEYSWRAPRALWMKTILSLFNMLRWVMTISFSAPSQNQRLRTRAEETWLVFLQILGFPGSGTRKMAVILRFVSERLSRPLIPLYAEENNNFLCGMDPGSLSCINNKRRNKTVVYQDLHPLLCESENIFTHLIFNSWAFVPCHKVYYLSACAS